jgi:uncharacterized membrane protein YphA (DoxX/SURF4 family)
MSLTFSLLMLALVGISLILIMLSLRFLRTTATADDAANTGARFFLIALRVAIGWHCFVEGMEKLSTPGWTSDTYLRESMGPFSPLFRGVAGDRLIEKVDVGENDTFPTALETEWQAHLNAFASHYELTEEQTTRAQGIFEQRKKDTLTTFISKPQLVTKIAAFQPEMKLEMTMKERVAEHHKLAQRVAHLEEKFPTSDKGVHAAWKSAKADLAKWRAGIKTVLDDETKKFRKALHDVQPSEYKTDPFTSEQIPRPPMPESVSLPVTSWRLLEFSDFMVKWSLVILGGCLMLGLLSRLTSFATALLIFSFYLAMPALPGWPESPRLEGHYLLVNKTFIEVIALLALGFLPTGRWAGLDGLLGLCCLPTRKTVTPAAETKSA